MRPGGFTLLEVMIALALVVALAAVAMPAVSGRLGVERADGVAREIRAGVASARGDAIRDGMVWRLVLTREAGAGAWDAGRPGAWRLVAREYRAGVSGQAASVRFVGPVFDDVEPAATGTDAEPVERTLLVLPVGASVSREAPVTLGDAGGQGSEDPALAGGGEVETWGGGGEEDEGVTLGLLLPTGAALAGSSVYVTLGGGEVLEVRLEAWTGVAVVARWRPPVEETWERGLPATGGADADRGVRP